MFKTQATIQVASVYRETPGNFGPAVVGDLLVEGQIEAGERLVDLQTSERKKRYGSTSSRYRRNVWS